MKTLAHYYKTHPVLALIINCVGFFLWATTMIIMMVILTVAFTH